MRIQLALEFDLEDESGNPIADHAQLAAAADQAEDAIRNRLIGGGFLQGDFLIGIWTLDARIAVSAVGEPDHPP